METACLRIKFTPLLQNLQKEDSKHCLEIVPEITCIQNLDKIQWRKEENSIEYTIPMTYKIILRKKNVIKDNINETETLDKTYHSCVDLLLPSSDTNIMGLGSGDISRIVSDTFVLSKVTTDVEKCSIIFMEPNADSRNEQSIELITTQVQTDSNNEHFFTDELGNNGRIKRTNYKSRDTITTQTSPEVVQSESHVVQVTNADIIDCDEKSIDKNINTETPSNVEDKRSSGNFGKAFTINNKLETRRNLSLTPICSINTEDNEAEPVKRISSNTIVYLRYETQKEFACAEIRGNSVKSDDLYFSLYTRNHNNFCKTFKQYDCVTSHRVLPEVRVANFVQIMENEIMPLKLMLSDIISKCSSLGVSWSKSQQKPLINNEVNSEKQISGCKTKKQANSNRVVYSIVFDG
ncbi:uncharacterized protein LOC114359039 [Ostrinia furnacalis]|uniref:uncharacterized protein LOC114359039 n=1 Tax=Ostrinia furnacalis TaxID=93504 RepID=UPI00103B87B9|nr:uncharacterized protein LOC114359039 [Ostrinia furnacalis]